MDAYYVGRVHNDEVYSILKKEHQFSIDEEGAEESLNKKNAFENLPRKLKGRRRLNVFRNCKGNAMILFLGTNHWEIDQSVDAKSVLGYGLIYASSPYSFLKDSNWRHRLNLDHVVLLRTSEGHLGINIDTLIGNNGLRSPRFYRDWQDIVAYIVENLGGIYQPWDWDKLPVIHIQNKPIELDIWTRDDGYNWKPSVELSQNDYLDSLVSAPTPKPIKTGIDMEKASLPSGSGDPHRDARNKRLGFQGERWVLEYERARLRFERCSNLAENVRHISFEEGDGAGYDILSYNMNGTQRYIEVKTTTGNINTPFYITPNELRFAEEKVDSYCLYRVFEFNKSPKMYVIEGSLKDKYQVYPSMYQVCI